MAEQDSSASALPASSVATPPASSISASMAEFIIPTPLKFLMSNLKSIVNLQLNNENYAIWSLQIYKLFAANGFEGYLTGSLIRPNKPDDHADSRLRRLIDQNLVFALLCTISPSVLPYILHLSSPCETWLTLSNRLQPTNRSRVIQLKNELHNIQKKDNTMNQYLAQIKTLVDNIAAAGSHIDSEDILMYILNGLPSAYNAFKIAIRTSQLPISLDVLYSLLCSEEINIQNQVQREVNPSSDHLALYLNRPKSSRGKENPSYRERSNSRPPLPNNNRPSSPNNSTRPTCQICGKMGHTALTCWHRCNLQYSASDQTKALFSQPQANPTTDWVLDSGATSHLTANTQTL
ncbi:Retrovirus-related Pol polyprotein from transposon TNT 1-94 [Dendrobium catenatum]|uniref:Retrovirus-related Pol polyprotein from transposon TNT 1-94 n=1 Tax=Dendrobium catenatum TaxID=906689 RepID=A0A2I0WBU0_9ASPA|nr:Retrovirus-related Pol polyprotein from transposon TNT 1-94 [Dendrobium catenatum]